MSCIKLRGPRLNSTAELCFQRIVNGICHICPYISMPAHSSCWLFVPHYDKCATRSMALCSSGAQALRRLLNLLSIKVQSKHCEYVLASIQTCKTWGHIAFVFDPTLAIDFPCRLNHDVAPGLMRFLFFYLRVTIIFFANFSQFCIPAPKLSAYL